jgi:hypothetical protein
MPLTSGLAGAIDAERAVLRSSGQKEAAPAGGESGRRAYGPALGGEAGSVLMEAYPYGARESSLITHVAIILEHIWPGPEQKCHDALLLSSKFSHYENIGRGARSRRNHVPAREQAAWIGLLV